MIPFAKVDPEFAKDQLVLFLREWYMAPNGQIPAYEFAFDDVNPPVHAWAVYRVFKMTGKRGERDVNFLARCFQKLILNFNWSVGQFEIYYAAFSIEQLVCCLWKERWMDGVECFWRTSVMVVFVLLLCMCE